MDFPSHNELNIKSSRVFKYHKAKSYKNQELAMVREILQKMDMLYNIDQLFIVQDSCMQESLSFVNFSLPALTMFGMDYRRCPRNRILFVHTSTFYQQSLLGQVLSNYVEEFKQAAAHDFKKSSCGQDLKDMSELSKLKNPSSFGKLVD